MPIALTNVNRRQHIQHQLIVFAMKLRTQFLLLGAGLLLTITLGSCAQSTAPTTTSDEAAQPASVQIANTEAAADLSSAAIGTESGGAGMVLMDAFTVSQGGQIPDAV